jgi:hypothetical protein
VVGQGGGQQPGAVGGNLAGGQVRQAGARLQVADGQLAHGVVAPSRNQLLLVVEVPHATHDQPVAVVAGLGDCATPPGGSPMSTQARSGIAVIAARTVLVWRTVIE